MINLSFAVSTSLALHRVRQYEAELAACPLFNAAADERYHADVAAQDTATSYRGVAVVDGSRRRAVA